MHGRTGRTLLFTLLWTASLVAFLSPGTGAPPLFPGEDKLVHAGIFAALTLAALAAWPAPARVAAALVAYGAAVEVLQGVLPFGRTADVWDLAADTAGVALGVLAAAVLARRSRGPIAVGSRASAPAGPSG